MKKILHIGFDDTDSIKGSCTTYLATLIISEIFDQVHFLDFPNLIRLNPNIPFKTRGNGAVALRLKGDEKNLEFCKEIVIKYIEKFSRVDDDNTNPGIVFIKDKIPSSVKKFSQKALWDVLTIPQAEKLQKLSNIELLKYKNGRGIIGGLAAIGNQLEKDFTYEHLSYREEKNFGTKRKINLESVFLADKATPFTFNNIDYEYNIVLITPRGADPVFTGIRGENIFEVLKAWSMIKPLEKIPKMMIFRTNQHTNEHFKRKMQINKLKPFISAIVQGIVEEKPHYIEGSHLIFKLKDHSGEIDCAIYEPSKRFRGDLDKLLPGDKITVFGGVRPEEEKHPQTLNIERVKIRKLTPSYTYLNPICIKCKTRLKSAGKNKGYKCPKCSQKYRDLKRAKIELARSIWEKEYLPPIIAQRHLTRPFIRDTRTKHGIEIKNENLIEIMKNLVLNSKEG